MRQAVSSLVPLIKKRLVQIEDQIDIESPSRSVVKKLFEQYSLADFLPYQSYDPETQVFYNKSSVGFCFETLPLSGCGEETQTQLSSLFQNVLPLGGSLQILLIASPRIEEYLDKWKEARSLSAFSPEVIQLLTQKRIEFLRKKAQNWSSSTPLRTFRVIVSYSERHDPHNPRQVHNLETLREQIETTFKIAGMPISRISAQDLIERLDELINVSKRLDFPNQEWNEYQSLSDQLIGPQTQFFISKEGISQKEHEFTIKTFSVRRYPNQWYLGGMGELIGDALNSFLYVPCPFVLHLGVTICAEKTLKGRLLTKGTRVEMQANSPLGKWLPSLRREAAEWEFVRHQFEKNERLVRTHFQTMILESNKEKRRGEQHIASLFRSKGWEIVPDQFLQVPSYLSFMPMSWGEGITQDLSFFKKMKTTLSQEPANLMPIEGEWYGTSQVGMPLSGRRGQVFYWNPFANTAGNYNICVVGRSGSGKSVFMQELMTNALALGGRVFVLDVGRSFEKTAHLLGGQFIEFSTKSPICLNPFTHIPQHDPEAATETLSMLKSILGLMAAPQRGTNDKENAILEKALMEVWNKRKNEATITDIADFLKEAPEQEAKDLGLMLFPYTKKGIEEGTYGRFFNGPSTADFKSPLIVIELDELKDRKDLQSVILQMVIIQITQQMILGDRKTPFHIICDEGWDMLRGGQVGQFIEMLARRLRKYFGSLVIGTQSVNDFYASEGAMAAFENSDWMCLLSQKKESIEQLKKSQRLSIDAHMEKMLKSVTTRQGEFAEVMIYGPEGYAIGRLILDEFSRLLYSTKPDEYAAIKNLMKKGLSIKDAIERLAVYG